MRPISVGTKGSHSITVGKKDLAGTMEPSLPPVMATCVMSLMMEMAAIDAMKPYMEPGEMSVGIVVNVQHLAATPEGHKVTAYAEVTKVDGRRVEFNVRATDEMDEIGTGTHSRAVADRAKFDERLKKKIKQA
jgi:fluoroacetyl-CoA thioesterase